MTNNPRRRRPVLLPPAGVVFTESPSEFLELKKSVFEQYKPRGPIECTHAEIVVHILWEMRVLWRSKATLINLHIPEALGSLYDQVTESGDYIRFRRIAQRLGEQPSDQGMADKQGEAVLPVPHPTVEKLVVLGRIHFKTEWFESPDLREDFKRLLSRFGLDESAIHAVAMQMVAEDLERIDRRLLTLDIDLARKLRWLEDRSRQVDHNDGAAKVIDIPPKNPRRGGDGD